MTLDPRITFTRASIGTYYNSAGVLQTATTNGPRFDYDPVTHAARGLRIEEQRTNGLVQSQDFSVGNYVKTGATVTTNQTTAPDGTTTADLVTASASPATVSQVIIVSAGVPYVTSLYIRKGTSDWCYLAGDVAGTGAERPKAYFNLNTGTVGTIETNITSATIQAVGNGWHRCTLARLGTAGSENFMVGICDADNSATVTVGRTIYVWGAQAEVGASATFVTSYIPTTTAAVTRQPDIAVMTGTNFSSWYRQGVGTFIAEFELLSASGTRPILSADSNATAERIFLFGSGADPKLTINDGGVMQADLDLGTLAAGAPFKIGGSFAANDVAGCFDGGTVFTDLAATMPTPTQLRLGSEGTNYLNGWLRRVKFYIIAKSDSELAALTA